ncbi:MAG: hypothetical protein AAFR38_03965 [Planctomycetota bacterium]
MPATLTIRDQTTTPGGEDHTFELEFETESITVRELIRERVYQEVDDYNRAIRSGDAKQKFRGLVTPGELERELNGDNSELRRRQIDWNKQFEAATDAFEHNRVLVLVGDRQTESLNETIRIEPGMEVTFLRLVMLVGG